MYIYILSPLHFCASSLCFRLFLSILRHFPMMFFKVQSWRSVVLAWVIWTGLEASASEGTGTTHLLMWWLCLSSPVLVLPNPLQKVEVCKEDCGCISKYYLKDSLFIWWEITLRLLLWFIFINSEPGAPRAEEVMQATRQWWAGSKSSTQAAWEE